MKLLISIVLTAWAGMAAADAKSPAETDPISDYLTDITGGAVSAANLVGVEKSAITQIQTSQDLVAAIQPFAADGQRPGFGFAVTPARTRFLPVSGRSYYDEPVVRVLSNITLSYAQITTEINQQNYTRRGYSIDTYYYLDPNKDPVVVDSVVWKRCTDKTKAENIAALEDFNKAHPPGKPLDEKAQEELTSLTRTRDAGLRACQDAATDSKTLWNASRLSLSFGQGRIARDSTGDAFSLGKSVTLNCMFGVGTKGAINASLRRTTHALDTDSLSKADVSYKSSRLAAVRLTYGDQEGTPLRAIAEVSHSSSTAGSDYTDVFKYAVGVDKKLFKGAWLEFRLGRNQSSENGKEQTSALMKVNILPSLMPW